MRKIILFLGVLLLTLGLCVGIGNATLHTVIDDNSIIYQDEEGVAIMTIDDDDGVTIVSLSTDNTYTTMTLTSTLAASSTSAGSFVTPGGIACAKQLWLGGHINMSTNTTGLYDIVLKDGQADGLSIKAGSTDMMVFTTATDAIAITPPVTITGLLTCGVFTVGASDDGETVTFYGDTVGSDFVWDEEGDTNVGTLTLGANTTGVDFKAFASTTGNYLLWDQSGDDLLLVGTATQLHIAGTTASTDATSGSLKTAGGLGVAGNTFMAGTLVVGADGAGRDFTVYGATNYKAWWDANFDTNGAMLFGADTKGVMVVMYGGTTGCGVFWDPNTDTNGTLSVGATGGDKGVDLMLYGKTTGNYIHWDQSGDDLLLVGTAVMVDIAGTTDSTGVTSGAVSIDGGLGVAKSIFVGGNISIATGKIITTTAELTLNSVNPLTIQFGGVDWLQMDEAAISSFAAAEDNAGHAVYIESEDGGVDGGTTSLGMAGGAISLKTGDGSAAVTTNAVGGAGGALTLTTGAGLTGHGTDVGGVGGAVAVTAGAGGSSGGATGTGGVGGSITLTAGAGGAAGGGTAGAPGKVDIAAGLLHMGVQTIDMNDTTVVTTLVPGTPAGTLITGNILYVDANGAGAEVLKLPHESDGSGAFLVIVNTGGETITIQNDAAGAVLTLETLNTAFLVCDGTTWRGAVCVP